MAPATAHDLPTEPMPPEAREQLTQELLAAARHAYGDGLTGATVKGSAFKGGFIPYYSDFDLHLFVDAQRVPMLDPLTPAMEPALRFQAAAGHLDPADFALSSIQVYAVDQDSYPEEWTPPLPGTYKVVYGALPSTLPVVTNESLAGEAHQFFASVPGQITKLVGRIVDKPDRALAGYVRLLGTGVKPSVYHASVLREADPRAVWQQTLPTLLPQVEAEACPSRALSRFFGHAVSWRETRQDPEALRQMFRLGCTALQDLAAWAAVQPQ